MAVKEQNALDALRGEIDKREKAHRKALTEAQALGAERERVHTDFGVKIEKKNEESHRLGVALGKAQAALARVRESVPKDMLATMAKLEVLEREQAAACKSISHTLDDRQDALARAKRVTFDPSSLLQFEGPAVESEADLHLAKTALRETEKALATARAACATALEGRTKEAREELASLGL